MTGHFRILDLPPELLQNVAGCLHEDNFSAMRMACRTFESACSDMFAARYVRATSWHLNNPKDLQQAKWLLNSRWANKVRSFELAMMPELLHRIATVQRQDESFSDSHFSAEAFAQTDAMEMHNLTKIDQAMLVSILRDLLSLSEAELSLELEQDVGDILEEARARLNPDIAQDVLHETVCAGNRITSLSVMDNYSIDPDSVGYPGFLELCESARGLKDINVSLDINDLLPFPGTVPVTYAEARERRQAIFLVTSAAESLESLRLARTPTFDQLLSNSCQAMTVEVLFANPLSFLTCLELVDVCCQGKILEEVLGRCITTLRDISFVEIMVLGGQDGWGKIFRQLKAAIRLEKFEFESLCRLTGTIPEIASLSPSTGAELACVTDGGIAWKVEGGTSKVQRLLDHMSQGTLTWGRYDGDLWQSTEG